MNKNVFSYCSAMAQARRLMCDGIITAKDYEEIDTILLQKYNLQLPSLLNVDVFFQEQNIHSISGEGELMLSILASFAQEESRSVSENQKWRIRHAFEKGELMNWRFMFGYTIEHGKIEVNHEEA